MLSYVSHFSNLSFKLINLVYGTRHVSNLLLKFIYLVCSTQLNLLYLVLKLNLSVFIFHLQCAVEDLNVFCQLGVFTNDNGHMLDHFRLLTLELLILRSKLHVVVSTQCQLIGQGL